MDKLRITKKKFPLSYPDEVTKTVNLLSIGGTVFMTGSSSMRNQLYSSDYDAHNVIRLTESTKQEALEKLATKFQKMVAVVNKLENTFISDIKAGIREDWRILRRDARLIGEEITNYSPEESRAKIKELHDSNIISEKEAKKAYNLIKDSPSIQEFLEAKSKLKFHIIRWSVKSVMENKNVLRDKSILTLEEAFDQPSMTKIDVVTLLQKNRFVEISMNYEFYNNSHQLNPDDINWEGSFQEGIKGFVLSGNFFKVLKRCYSMAREAEDFDELERIRGVLNGDLGRMYNVISDISLIIEIIEKKLPVSVDILQYEIDQFAGRLSQIYTINEFLKKENKIMKELHDLSTAPKNKIAVRLVHLKKLLNKVVQKEAKKILRRDFRECLKSVTLKQKSTKPRVTRKQKRI